MGSYVALEGRCCNFEHLLNGLLYLKDYLYLLKDNI